MSEYRMILPEEIFSNREIHSYIECGNNCLGAIGLQNMVLPTQNAAATMHGYFSGSQLSGAHKPTLLQSPDTCMISETQ